MELYKLNQEICPGTFISYVGSELEPNLLIEATTMETLYACHGYSSTFWFRQRPFNSLDIEKVRE